MSLGRRTTLLFLPLTIFVIVADYITKRAVEQHFVPHVPYRVFGEVARITLTYNRAGAMGLSFGPWSRAILVFFTLLMISALARWYWRNPTLSTWNTIALALVLGGALGNLADRLWATQGVVDFIDVGVGAYRFWTFNVADIGVTVGACLLALTWPRESLDPGEKAA